MIRGELCKVVLWEKGMFDEISERVRSEKRGVRDESKEVLSPAPCSRSDCFLLVICREFEGEWRDGGELEEREQNELDSVPFTLSMSAEEALDTLTALFPQHSTTLLKQYLNASNQDVARAFRAIERGQESIVTSKSKRRKVDSGLKDWLKRDNKVEQAEVLVLSDSEEEESRNEEDNKLSSLQPTTNNELNPPIKSAFTLLKPPKSFSSNPNPTSTTIQANSIATHVNLPPLRLTTPAMITRETRGLITLVENALPEELASRLFVRMVEASRGEGKGDKTPCEFQKNALWCSRDVELTYWWK